MHEEICMWFFFLFHKQRHRIAFPFFGKGKGFFIIRCRSLRFQQIFEARQPRKEDSNRYVTQDVIHLSINEKLYSARNHFNSWPLHFMFLSIKMIS